MHYTADPEWQRLYAAVCLDPLDDAVRLAVADWLDERPTTYKQCPACTDRTVLQQSPEALRRLTEMSYRGETCQYCNGTHEVPDTETPDRAAFIRGQIKLAASGAVEQEAEDLRVRCDIAARHYGPRWIPDATEAQTRFATQMGDSASPARLFGYDVMVEFRRGFADAVELPHWAAFSGQGGGAAWVRAMPLTGILFRHFPLPGFYATCGKPRIWVNNIPGLAQQTTRGEVYLPAEFKSLLKGGQVLIAAYGDREYETSRHAYADLSQALVRRARAAAGLPDIELPHEPMESS